MIMNLESFHVQVKSIGMFLRDHLLKSVYITFKMALKNNSLKSFFFFFFFFLQLSLGHFYCTAFFMSYSKLVSGNTIEMNFEFFKVSSYFVCLQKY